MKYNSNKRHRDGSANKTQWITTVSVKQEENIFRFGHKKNWVDSKNCFSVLVVPRQKIEILDQTGKLNFAKFVGDTQNEWHGWPANPLRSAVDLPPYKILKSWVDRRLAQDSVSQAS